MIHWTEQMEMVKGLGQRDGYRTGRNFLKNASSLNENVEKTIGISHGYSQPIMRTGRCVTGMIHSNFENNFVSCFSIVYIANSGELANAEGFQKIIRYMDITAPDMDDRIKDAISYVENMIIVRHGGTRRVLRVGMKKADSQIL